MSKQWRIATGRASARIYSNASKESKFRHVETLKPVQRDTEALKTTKRPSRVKRRSKPRRAKEAQKLKSHTAGSSRV